MKANTDKCHLLVTRNTDVTAKIGEFDVKNSWEEKPLGVKIDTKLSFENHVSFYKSSKTLESMKACITSQFNYCPLIWMYLILM